MNSKPTLLVNENKTIFQSNLFEEMWEQYFNVEIINLNKTYDKKSTIVVSEGFEFRRKSNLDELTIANKGIRHIIDRCWDSWDYLLDDSADFTLRPRDFIRIHESLLYSHLGYNKFNLVPTNKYDFLMLIHKKHKTRTDIYNKLQPVLENNIYSYVGDGISLQNANDQVYNETSWERYIDPNWYKNTRFSVVVESIYFLSNSYQWPNVSEKTYKPCAFKHPFIVWGQPESLKEIKRLGFETFDHCIDESYDGETNYELRLQKVINNINTVIDNKDLFNDNITLEKIDHNYNLFYDQKVVMELFKSQILNPLLEFIES